MDLQAEKGGAAQAPGAGPGRPRLCGLMPGGRPRPVGYGGSDPERAGTQDLLLLRQVPERVQDEADFNGSASAGSRQSEEKSVQNLFFWELF